MRIKREGRELLNNIPISINAQLGDPFQQSQWDDTREKLIRLENVGYRGSVALITKSVLTLEQLFFIKQSNLDLFVFFSITGLNENKGASFATIKENYLKTCATGKSVAVFIRPIIPGYNDNIATIKPIIDMAAEGNNVVIIRGYKDIFQLTADAFIEKDFLATLVRICKDKGVKVYDRTASYVASLRCNHFLNYGEEKKAIGTDLLQYLGYPVRMENGEVVLDANYESTQGDLNFIRMVSGQVIKRKMDKKDAVMTIKRHGIMLDCSSSWFGWVRRIPCEINCWYCIAKAEEKVRHKEQRLGCIPTELL